MRSSSAAGASTSRRVTARRSLDPYYGLRGALCYNTHRKERYLYAINACLALACLRSAGQPEGFEGLRP